MHALDYTPSGSWGINYGGGVNSTALLLLAYDYGLRPDWVLWCDTGSEWPETYALIAEVERWCASVGYPFSRTRWERTRKPPLGFESVHANCLRTNYLPSKAYGYAGCTMKWKIQPAEKWRAAHGFSASTIALGYDTTEERRVRRALTRSEGFWYPLVAWGVSRDQCEDRIRQQGWKPHKSACWCCPSTTSEEWAQLRRDHPDLYETAAQIELNARAAGNADTASIFRRAKECVWCHS